MSLKGLRGLSLDQERALPLEEAADYLKNLPSERRPFFIYANHFIFYALSGQPSPQPFLWFDENLTHRGGEPDESRLCEALKRNDVRTILLEGQGDLAEDSLLCLKRWVRSDFVMDRAIPPFYFYRRRARLGGDDL